jgi:hypothetical protein
LEAGRKMILASIVRQSQRQTFTARQNFFTFSFTIEYQPVVPEPKFPFTFLRMPKKQWRHFYGARVLHFVELRRSIIS